MAFITLVVVAGICLFILYVINPVNISDHPTFPKIIHGLLYLSIALALVLGVLRNRSQ